MNESNDTEMVHPLDYPIYDLGRRIKETEETMQQLRGSAFSALLEYHKTYRVYRKHKTSVKEGLAKRIIEQLDAEKKLLDSLFDDEYAQKTVNGDFDKYLMSFKESKTKCREYLFLLETWKEVMAEVIDPYITEEENPITIRYFNFAPVLFEAGVDVTDSGRLRELGKMLLIIKNKEDLEELLFLAQTKYAAEASLLQVLSFVKKKM